MRRSTGSTVTTCRMEQTLADACVVVGAHESRSVLRRWVAEHDRVGQDERDERDLDSRSLSVAEAIGGMLHLTGLLPAVAGREFRSELDRLERQLYLADTRDGAKRSNQQRRADALAMMARRSATLDIDEYDAKRSPRILLSVVVGRGPRNGSCEPLPDRRDLVLEPGFDLEASNGIGEIRLAGP